MAADVLPGRAAPVRVDRRQARPDHLHPDAAAGRAERQRWRAQYDQAKSAAEAVDNCSATAHRADRPDCPQLGLTR